MSEDPTAAPDGTASTSEASPPSPSTPPTEAVSTPPAPEPVVDQLAVAAAAQSPAEPQSVPEVRPQAFVNPSPDAVSDTSIRMGAGAPAHGEAEYEAAKPDNPATLAAQAEQNLGTPNLLVGQRVQIVGDHPEAGRMGLVQQIIHTDPIQAMIAHIGGAEARFAKVLQYVLLTRDGRSDTLVATPDQVKPLDENNGWGRGTI